MPAPFPATEMSWQGKPPQMTSTAIPSARESLGGEGSDVVIAGDVGPVLGEDASAVGVDLAEGDGSHSGALKAKRETADAGKEIEDAHSAACLAAPRADRTAPSCRCSRGLTVARFLERAFVGGDAAQVVERESLAARRDMLPHEPLPVRGEP